MTEIIDNKRIKTNYEDIEPLKPFTSHVYDEAFMEDVIWQFYETTISNYDLPKYKRFTRQYIFDSKKKSDLIFQLDKAFIIVEIQQDRLNQEHINRAHAYATQLENEQNSDDVKVLYVSNTIGEKEIKLIENLGHEYFTMEKEFFIKRAEDNVEGLKLVTIDKSLEIAERPLKSVFVKNLDMLREIKGLNLKQLSRLYNKKYEKRLDNATLHHISSGKKNPTIQQIRNLAEFFEVHPDVLIKEKTFVKVIGYSNNYIVTNDYKRELKVFVPSNWGRFLYDRWLCIVNEGKEFNIGKYVLFYKTPITRKKDLVIKGISSMRLLYFESDSSENLLGFFLGKNLNNTIRIRIGYSDNPENIINNFDCDRIYLSFEETSEGNLLTLNEYSNFIEGLTDL
jgi:transcriptional regulator with XRE-family HTH domain